MSRVANHMLMVMIVFSFFAACRGKQAEVVEGGLYCHPGENGGFAVLKVLKVDQYGVHVRLYSNHYDQPPIKIDESTLYMAGMDRKPDQELGAGHLPISNKSFATWGVRFVQQSTVKDDELDGYRMWLDAKGGYF